MKVVVSIIPVALSILISMIGTAYPSIINNINKFIETIFGLKTQNVYAPILTFLVSFIIFISLARLLTRKAIIKQR